MANGGCGPICVYVCVRVCGAQESARRLQASVWRVYREAHTHRQTQSGALHIVVHCVYAILRPKTMQQYFYIHAGCTQQFCAQNYAAIFLYFLSPSLFVS